MTRLARAIALLVVSAPAARAEVDINKGKTLVQIYDNGCAGCHRSVRGLAHGRGASALTSFLTEHYTSSAKDAAAMAAYVLGGGGVGTPAASQPPRPRAPLPTPLPPPPKPTIVVVVPNAPVTPSPSLNPPATEPVESQPDADASVPRDSIPD